MSIGQEPTPIEQLKDSHCELLEALKDVAIREAARVCSQCPFMRECQMFDLTLVNTEDG